MSSGEKKEWLLVMYSTIMYFSLIHIKNLFLFYNIDYAHGLNEYILYGGPVFAVIAFGVLYHLKKKYGTPNAIILRDKQLLIPFIIMIVLAIVLGIGSLL